MWCVCTYVEPLTTSRTFFRGRRQPPPPPPRSRSSSATAGWQKKARNSFSRSSIQEEEKEEEEEEELLMSFLFPSSSPCVFFNLSSSSSSFLRAISKSTKRSDKAICKRCAQDLRIRVNGGNLHKQFFLSFLRGLQRRVEGRDLAFPCPCKV